MNVSFMRGAAGIGIAVMLSAVSACRDADAKGQATARTDTADDVAAARSVIPTTYMLSPREQAIARWLDRQFPLQPGLSARYRQSIRARISLINNCRSAPCRNAATAQRAAAVAFASGRTANVPGLGFASGVFRREEAGFSGVTRIIPLRRDAALLAGSLSFRGRPSCALAAVLTPAGSGSWIATPASGEGKPLRLSAEGADAFMLRYTDPAHRPYDDSYCSVGVGIDGRYVRADPA